MLINMYDGCCRIILQTHIFWNVRVDDSLKCCLASCIGQGSTSVGKPTTLSDLLSTRL